MSFKDLDVWKRSARLSAELYKALNGLKDYGFRDQITRAGLSIPCNIAEGFDRDSAKETLRFLYYAKGSSAELETQIFIGLDIGYILGDQAQKWLSEVHDIQAMLGGLIRKKKKR